MSNSTVNHESLYGATKGFSDLRIQHWLQHDVFTGAWWFLLALTLVPWIVWWKLADKHRLMELICFGSLAALVSVILDATGTVNLWWGYKTELIIYFPGLLVADITDIPVGFMLVHQYCSRWKSFSIVSSLLSAFFSFVGEPIMEWTGTYDPLTWRHFYSLPIYIGVALLIRLLVLSMKRQVDTCH